MLAHDPHWHDLLNPDGSLDTYHFDQDPEWKAFETRLKHMSYYRVCHLESAHNVGRNRRL